VGMVFMVFALTKTFAMFRVSDLMKDSLRWAVSAAAILLAGWLAAQVPFRGNGLTRSSSIAQLAVIGAVCIIVAGPAVFFTQAVTAAEGRSLLHSLLPRRVSKAPIVGEGRS
jgi:hypothetical protein